MPNGRNQRCHQSGEGDCDGHISRRGDVNVRVLLDEAATMMLTRTSAETGLRAWGLRLKDKPGFKRAAVAVARKLAVIMHAMLVSGQRFDRSAGHRSHPPWMRRSVSAGTWMLSKMPSGLHALRTPDF